MVAEKNKPSSKPTSSLGSLVGFKFVTTSGRDCSSFGKWSDEPFEEDLNKVTDQLKHVVEHIQVVEKRLQEVSDGIAKSQKDENALRSKLDKLGSRFVKDQASLDDALKSVEKMLNRRNLALQRRDHAMKRLGSWERYPPKEIIENFSKMERSEIEEQLKSTSQELNKFSHVNKKAMDQYINFSERKEELLKKKKR